MPDRQRELPSLRSDHGAVFKVSSYRRCIERRRHHHHDTNLWPSVLKAFQECERKVAVQVTLVEFVEDNCVDTLERRMGQQTAG
jgi:hypothetical protein